MSKQTVNIGTSANDRTGDSLRTAFNKINDNFNELYVALGLGDGTLNIGAFEFNGSTMTTNDSSGIIIAQKVTVTSDLTLNGIIQTTADATTPSDTNNAAGYMQIDINGQAAWIRYYR